MKFRWGADFGLRDVILIIIGVALVAGVERGVDAIQGTEEAAREAKAVAEDLREETMDALVASCRNARALNQVLDPEGPCLRYPQVRVRLRRLPVVPIARMEHAEVILELACTIMEQSPNLTPHPVCKERVSGTDN